MSSVKYSIPEQVKAAFNAAFAGRNKSAIVAELMRAAIERKACSVRSQQAIARILARRPKAPFRGTPTLTAARVADRA